MSAIEERAFIWTGYALIVIVVFLSLFAILNKMADNVKFQQDIYSKDIALTESVLLSNTGYSTIITLNVNPEFEFFLDKCRVNVNKIRTSKGSSSDYFCADNENIVKDFNIDGSYDALRFILEEDRLSAEGTTHE